MVTTFRPIVSGYSRLWLIENRAGPANTPAYEGQWRAGALSWSQGDITQIQVPDDERYGVFRTVSKVVGQKGNPSLPVIARYERDARSTLLRLAGLSCDHDLQLHIGLCQNPQDENTGWDKILVLPGARLSDYGTSELGALSQDENAVVNEEVTFEGIEDPYEIVKLTAAEQAASAIVQEILAVIVCDSVQCGDCGVPSDGCSVVFAVTLTAGGSPGLAAEVIYTEDGGTNWSDTNVSTLAVNEDPNDLACVGTNLVVISEDSESLHYAPIADILDAAETWAEVTSGFVAANGPLAIYSLSPRHTWIVGENGYVYFTSDPTSSVEVQDAGVATTENLNDVHAFNSRNIVAVGANNAVIVSRNGSDWSAVTGPSVGAALNCIFMRSEDEWFVGDAGGQLWYTRDGGTNWTEKTFPGSGSGVVRDIKFPKPGVGYLAHSTSTPAGRILRSNDGGYSWYVLPEAVGVNLPANDYVAALGVCDSDPNVCYGGGLADDAADGYLVKLSPE